MWYEDIAPADWGAAIRQADEPKHAAQDLAEAWLHDKLDAFADPSGDLTTLDRTLGQLFAALESEIGEVGDVFLDHQRGSSERYVRRWCWASMLWASEQDEDALIAVYARPEWLLEEANLDCPKSGEARRIAAMLTNS